MESTFQRDTSVSASFRTATNPTFTQTIIGRKSALSQDIEEFRGIPYGYVPRRWEHSRLREQLPDDVYDATKNGPKCPAPGVSDSRSFQSYLPFPNDDEDEFACLNLFVVRPSSEAIAKIYGTSQTVKLPVMVWIHGGGFADGSCTDPVCDPSRLVHRAIVKGTPFIAVAMNYRLNIFGFGASSTMLAAQDSNASIKGVNFGLHDQKIALIWIKHHVSEFGGDPTRITIMGQSAGATSCHIHLLEAESSARKPLFHKAVLMSGAFGGLDVSLLEKADERWEKLCQWFSFQELGPADRLESLKHVPAHQLLCAVSELCWRFFTLTIDGSTINQVDTDSSVSVHLGNDDMETHLKDIGDDVQVLLGATSQEFYGFVRMANWTFEEFSSLFKPCFPSQEVAQRIQEAYGIIRTSPNELVQDGLVQFVSDATMTYTKTHRAAEHLKSHRSMRQRTSQPNPRCVRIHQYHVEFGNPFLGPMHGIAHHGVDLVYSFGNFEAALENCDRGIPEGYVEPGSDAPEQIPTDTSPTINLDRQQDYKSHVDLSRYMQDELVDFIVEQPCDSDGCGHVDQTKLYCSDRSVRMESWTDREEWGLTKARYDALEKDFVSMVVASKKLVRNVLNMSLD
ncbi:alpha/beta-hydrolase [Colletotrichum scovillei]|uniref:Carboxylic ester hydrolase n=1 Tax=Colletotrichum scovillei TaxID=1209932 RepID=A0A9P7UJU1_9PEZI|nr:alpha/beta-hydrolase [Colletotrichum scovillei]KAF4773800.1 alpha/beta-hydrolase [Colletotrichum scovillei]KAG7056152.1 para-nitrobenzyl esterase [Colletotrichum scovillei]KAG7075594.1 para-nitrobenzyl esterase [Colletotrichum scovillei]KAG7082707.1 para-nitrobenzyl esterase [Colletotrichum scovillei]